MKKTAQNDVAEENSIQIGAAVTEQRLADGENMQRLDFTVTGMTCAACQANVEKALGAVNGVDKVEVDLENAKATVYTSCDGIESELIAAVKNAGYEASAEK